jgi:lysophospholipase L1-like esterase
MNGMERNSRRKFIQNAALTSLAVCYLPSLESVGASGSKPPKKKAREGMVILFQGDSITDGNRGRTADPNHVMGHGYAFSIASRLGADYPEKKYRFYNRGISGNKVNDLEKRWQTDTLDLKPDLLSILVGVNDSASVVFKRDPVIPPAKYEEIYTSLLTKTLSEFPGIVFVLCEPFILKVGRVAENWEAYQADMVQRQAIVRKLADKFNAVFVGSQEVFDKACEKAPAEYWMWDGVHPTVAGHELMAREWLRQVEKRINF